MRKILILVILIALIFGAYTLVMEGISYQNIKTVSLNDLETKSEELKMSLLNLEVLNTTQYTAKKVDLESAVKKYKTEKEKYEELLPAMQAAAEESSFTTVDLYDIDFLWTIIGNYATDEGIVLKFDVAKSATSLKSMGQVTGMTDYIFCDLNFTVSGGYITITDFIYDLEDDDRLNFEISNFKLEKGGQNLQATFSVKSVPINNKNLSKLTSSSAEKVTSTSTGNNSNTNNTSTSASSTTTNTTTNNDTTDKDAIKE